jgi:riboflavin kinase / FMN adenylyltransferase
MQARIPVKLFNGSETYYSIKRPILTIGTFDGVHIGHQKIVNRLNEIAGNCDGESVLFTFNPHPRLVLFPDYTDLKLIQTQVEKEEKLRRLGLQNLIVYPFSKDFSRTPATEFIRNYLVNKINVHTIVIGYDHQFGKNREGSLEHLKELAPIFHFDLEEIPAQDIDDVRVSSTKIRRALEIGEMDVANKFLGEPFQLNGTIVHGQQIGRTIGYPTANIEIDDPLKLIPANGVYAVRCLLNQHVYRGMMNIGNRPTVAIDTQERNIEIHLFDFEGDIYGHQLKVEVLQFLRHEIRFDTIETLSNQLKQDEYETRAYFNHVSLQPYSL